MTGALVSERVINTHDMVVVHGAFRRESRMLRDLIAAVPDGDTDRAEILSRHLVWYEAGLTNHHHGEDEQLWPLLHERASVDAALVRRMQRQHDHVTDTLAGVLRALSAWQASASAECRDLLVSMLSAHRQVLIEHLDDEEHHLLPLAARYLTSPEWAALGEHFVATTPKTQLFLFLGAVLEEATSHERATLLAAMPRVARLAWWGIGRRRCASYIRRVRRNTARENRQLPIKTLTVG
jgi:hemerythrin-like domain-containing protein